MDPVISQQSVSQANQDARFELAAVLASPAFTRSARMAALLTYLCDKHFTGESDRVKEYNIAVEVLGRPSSFDPSEDAIARVEVHRLRRKLREYYEGEGATHRVQIQIPTGSYAPVFGVAGDAPTVPPEVSPAPLASSLEPVVVMPMAIPQRVAKRWPLGALLAAVVVMASVAYLGAHRGSNRVSAVPPVAAASVAFSEPMVAGDEVRILCGQTRPHTDRLGKVWGVDRFYTGGGAAMRPRLYLARTYDTLLFQGVRTGNFSYDIPLRPGNYEMRLYFAEMEFGPGMSTGGGENSRVFQVMLNGQPLLTSFDVVSDGGGAMVADVRTFKDVTPDREGKLHLQFVTKKESPMVSAIELVHAPPHRINPVRITTQENSYTDAAGNVWSPDNYFLGGQRAIHDATVQGYGDPDFFRSERYGNFSYAIPVAAGVYDVVLYMAETFWGPENPGGGGVGSRVFDILANGVALERRVDLVRQAGANRAVVKKFSGLRPNAQGKLVISFIPEENYGSVHGIEVLNTGE